MSSVLGGIQIAIDPCIYVQSYHSELLLCSSLKISSGTVNVDYAGICRLKFCDITYPKLELVRK